MRPGSISSRRIIFCFLQVILGWPVPVTRLLRQWMWRGIDQGTSLDTSTLNSGEGEST